MPFVTAVAGTAPMLLLTPAKVLPELAVDEPKIPPGVGPKMLLPELVVFVGA